MMGTIKDMLSKAEEAEKKNNYRLSESLFGEIENFFRQQGKNKKADYFKARKIEAQAKHLRMKGILNEAADKIKTAAEVWQSIKRDKEYCWCMANFYSWKGKHLMTVKDYLEASEYFKEAKHFFEKIRDSRSSVYCEAYMYESQAFFKKSESNYRESAELFFIASERFRSIQLLSESLYCEMNAWGNMGQNEMRNRNFLEAKKYFLLASTFAEVLENDSNKNWYKAHYYECEYQLVKGGGDLDNIISVLEKIVECYEKTKDKIALYVSKGDLSKYRGIRFKIKNELENAINCFNESQSYYIKAAKLDFRNSKKHESSAAYVSALAIETEAIKSFVSEHDFEKASEKFRVASEEYNRCEDYKSSAVCNSLYELCKALSEGDVTNASKILGQSFPGFPVYGPIKETLQFIKIILQISSSHTNKLLKEIIEFDKGPSFEARIRELIRHFDDREVEGGKIGIIPPEKIRLRKYDEVKEEVIKPESDEIGIVFNDETPVEIDVFACRKEGNRRYILISECKHRPNYQVSIKDLDILLKKSKLIKKRYSKVAKLLNEYEPIIEEIWFVTTGKFSKEAKSFAVKNNMRIISLDALNSLLKMFGLRPMKYGLKN